MRIHGYALIESLIASVILATGLLAAASVFCVSARASSHNRQRAIATLLAQEKMEELRHPNIAGGQPSGGGLDPLYPVSGFREFIIVDSRNPPSIEIIPSSATHLRLWEIRGTDFHTATVAVFELRGVHSPVELFRLSSGW